MPFTFDVLMTDALVYLLLVLVLGFVFYATRHEHLRAPWRQVRRRPMAMAALVVILIYVSIGLIDSIHVRLRDDSVTTAQGQAQQAHYSNEVLSVLDILLTRLRTQNEKTFSAPFALQLYTKQSVEQADGSIKRLYPKLQYGGAHLSDDSKRSADIAIRIALATAQTVFAMLVVILFVLWHIRREREAYVAALGRLRRGDTDTPWRSILLMVAIVLLGFFSALNLATHYHIFGTDQVGNDVFFKSLKSIRTGLLIGTLTTLVMLPFAIMLGVMAGYFRGWIDDAIQYLYTTLSSIPDVLLIAAVVLTLQVYMGNHPEKFDTLVVRSDWRLLFLCLILGVTSWTGLCRLLRGETMKLCEVDYVQAATALGVRHSRILLRHLLPNIMHIVLITVVLQFSFLVLAEAVLSYVGVGVDPTMDSWGNMINGARLEMAREPMVWWNLAAAFVLMFGLVLSANLFSDAVRDAFDPRLRQR